MSKKLRRVSIDLETLGTRVNSQIVSIGACVFDLTGKIYERLEVHVELREHKHLNATASTIKWWIGQAVSNPEAAKIFQNKGIPMHAALAELRAFMIKDSSTHAVEVWANGTKMDLAMLEYQYQLCDLPIPWPYNADCCMRTLRKIVGNLEVDFTGVAHNALDDSIWQAKYIAKALTMLGDRDA